MTFPPEPGEEAPPSAVTTRKGYPECSRCPHPWHGLRCDTCGCKTSFEDQE